MAVSKQRPMKGKHKNNGHGVLYGLLINTYNVTLLALCMKSGSADNLAE